MASTSSNEMNNPPMRVGEDRGGGLFNIPCLVQSAFVSTATASALWFHLYKNGRLGGRGKDYVVAAFSGAGIASWCICRSFVKFERNKQQQMVAEQFKKLKEKQKLREQNQQNE